MFTYGFYYVCAHARDCFTYWRFYFKCFQLRHEQITTTSMPRMLHDITLATCCRTLLCGCTAHQQRIPHFCLWYHITFHWQSRLLKLNWAAKRRVTVIQFRADYNIHTAHTTELSPRGCRWPVFIICTCESIELKTLKGIYRLFISNNSSFYVQHA